MQFTFLDMAGHTLFIRDDAERALWTAEEYTLDLEFPYNPGKVVAIGQRVFFIDPATGAHQVYEVRQAQTYEPDGYQQIVAENICISELSDCHIDNATLDNYSCADALATVLDGTPWDVGEKLYNSSSVNVSRGSVWEAVLSIKANYNVYIEPRTTLANDGTITRRLDIMSTGGVWRGVRLSIDKNLLDPSVTYDDSEVYTALYGYGGMISSGSTTEEDKQCDFTGVTWEATEEHPAKPYGQKYLEDPSKTELYGRNGVARYGFYQNNDITDPETLLEKTWETLKTVSTPKVSVAGSVADLYRLGYADQPISLHDIARVEILPAGFVQDIQIIRMTVDLLDATATTLTIGAYVPNIIYISAETNKDATGRRGGGGGNTSDSTTWQEFRTSIKQINDGTALRFESVQNDINHQEEEIAVQTGRIDVAYNKITAEVQDRRNADNILTGKITVEAGRITQEVTQRKAQGETLSARITVEAGRITQEVKDRTASYASMSSKIEQTSDRITAEVTRASRAEGLLSGRLDVTAESITAEVTRATAAEGELSGKLTVTAEKITAEVTRASTAEGALSGRLDVTAEQINAEVTRATTAEGTLSGRITVNSDKVSLVVSEEQGGYTVNAAQIVAGINDQDGSYVLIQANKINLSGYVTTSMLESAFTSAQQMSTQQMTISQYFTCLGHNVSWKTATVPKLSYSSNRNFNYTTGSGNVNTMSGYILTAHSDTTIYYLGR